MATYVSGNTLQVAFFSGSAAPVFTMDALAHSTDLCGTYTYVADGVDAGTSRDPTLQSIHFAAMGLSGNRDPLVR